MSEQGDGDDTVEIPNLRRRVLTATEQAHAEGEKLLDDPDYVTARERAWIKWFNTLPENDKKVVRICTEKGVSVTPSNIDQLKAIVEDHYGDDWGGLPE